MFDTRSRRNDPGGLEKKMPILAFKATEQDGRLRRQDSLPRRRPDSLPSQCFGKQLCLLASCGRQPLTGAIADLNTAAQLLPRARPRGQSHDRIPSTTPITRLFLRVLPVDIFGLMLRVLIQTNPAAKKSLEYRKCRADTKLSMRATLVAVSKSLRSGRLSGRRSTILLLCPLSEKTRPSLRSWNAMD